MSCSQAVTTAQRSVYKSAHIMCSHPGKTQTAFAPLGHLCIANGGKWSRTAFAAQVQYLQGESEWKTVCVQTCIA